MKKKKEQEFNNIIDQLIYIDSQCINVGCKVYYTKVQYTKILLKINSNEYKITRIYEFIIIYNL